MKDLIIVATVSIIVWTKERSVPVNKDGKVLPTGLTKEEIASTTALTDVATELTGDLTAEVTGLKKGSTVEATELTVDSTGVVIGLKNV